jgi:hypothetical protein
MLQCLAVVICPFIAGVFSIDLWAAGGFPKLSDLWWEDQEQAVLNSHAPYMI